MSSALCDLHLLGDTVPVGMDRIRVLHKQEL